MVEQQANSDPNPNPNVRFPFMSSLNASTLMPFRLGLREQIQVAAEAGYEGIEIWVKDMEAYIGAGNSLRSLRDEMKELGIEIPNAIAFFRWADQDEEVREEAMRQAKREMEMLAELGCKAVAAPPFGQVEAVTPQQFATRFAELYAIGRAVGVEPYLEFWGRAARLHTLEETIEVLECAELPDAKLLLDPFHMYTGGSLMDSLARVEGRQIGIVHANDYGELPPRETIADGDRLYPGDGIAPLGQLASRLHDIGYEGYLSLELFMDQYGDLSAADVAKLGLRKMKAAFSVPAN